MAPKTVTAREKSGGKKNRKKKQNNNNNQKNKDECLSGYVQSAV